VIGRRCLSCEPTSPANAINSNALLVKTPVASAEFLAGGSGAASLVSGERTAAVVDSTPRLTAASPADSSAMCSVVSFGSSGITKEFSMPGLADGSPTVRICNCKVRNTNDNINWKENSQLQKC
jgi:hypothetical protein